MMLTAQQKRLYDYIASKGATGAPSYREMQAALGLCSVSGVHRLVKCLEERGFVKRIARRSRCIEIIRRTSGSAPHADAASRVENIAATGYGDVAAYREAILAIEQLAAANHVLLTA